MNESVEDTVYAQWNFYRELCNAKNDETKELGVLHAYYLTHPDWFYCEVTELENVLKSYRKHWSRDCYLKLLVKYLLNLKNFNPITMRKRCSLHLWQKKACEEIIWTSK